jgi:hypothetical protein
LALCGVFALSLLIYWISVGFDGFSIFSKPDAGSFMQGVFGSAVALAGALVAIRIASVAVKLQEEAQILQRDAHQKEEVRAHFEMLELISSKVDVAVRPILEMIQSFQFVYALSTRAYGSVERVREHLNENDADPKLMQAALKRDLKALRSVCMALQEELDSLADRFFKKSLISDPVAESIFRGFACNKVRVPSGGYEAFLPLYSMPEWGQWFDTYARNMHALLDLDDIEFYQRINMYYNFSYLVKDGDGNKFDNVAVRSLLFMGAILDNGTPNCSAANLFIALLEAIPKGDAAGRSIETQVVKLLPEALSIPDGLQNAIRAINFDSDISVSMAQAIAGYVSIRPAIPQELLTKAGMA